MDVHRRLCAVYGPLPERVPFDPLSQFVLTMLGARTPGAVSERVFTRLRRHYRCWDDLRDTSARVLLPLIQPVTYAERKVVWLPQALLQIMRLRGDLALDFLADWPPDAARAWLERLPGAGPKVSAAVLNFSTLRMPALVVDTHHLRVAKRLGLAPRGASIASAAYLLQRQLPATWSAADFDDHHTYLKQHAITLCRHLSPLCTPCPLQDICAAYATRDRTVRSRPPIMAPARYSERRTTRAVRPASEVSWRRQI